MSAIKRRGDSSVLDTPSRTTPTQGAATPRYAFAQATPRGAWPA